MAIRRLPARADYPSTGDDRDPSLRSDD